jgi:hypothetical protein
MPFSDDELALIEAIHAAPGWNDRREEYAHWCKGHDLYDLADLIHIQCCSPIFGLSTKGGIHLVTDPRGLSSSDLLRVDRATELLSRLYPSERFPETKFRDEISRGLPVYEIELNDSSLPLGVAELHLPSTPLARFGLDLTTARFPAWLQHSLMKYVDTLTVRNARDHETGKIRPFSEVDIKAIEACPVIDNLNRLVLCGPRIPDFEILANGLLSLRVWLTYED